MDSLRSTLRRAVAGREVAVAFAALVAGSVLVGAFVPWYLAVAAVSGVRNTALPWLGSGLLFDAAAVLVLYLQAVVVAGGYRALRWLAEAITGRRSGGTVG